MTTFPRNVRAIHQIEITSRCNLRCVYCPSPQIVSGKFPDRPAMDMTREIYERTLRWVDFYVRQGGQTELNLAGIGESTLHPHFAEFVRRARDTVGERVRLIFATNGLIHDEAMVRAIATYRPEVYVSLHRPEKAGPAIDMYKKYGIFSGVSADPSINANDWAGQVTWQKSGTELPCQWIRDGKVMVMAHGAITTCCLDASGQGTIGHVDDPIGSIQTKPYDLCKKCYQRIDEPTWDQLKGTER